MMKSLQRIGIVSAATVLSRLLGLLRDILMFAVFGASALNSAFLFAFTLPNLFRRLLGEGALMAATVPVLSAELEERGRGGVFSLLSKIIIWLIGISAVLVTVFMAGFGLVPLIGGLAPRWYVSADLAMWVFPYLGFVCVAALLGAALNVLNRFAVPALSAVWLNLGMITCLAAGVWLFAETPEARMRFLCAGVLAGGAIQVLVPLAALVREGWRPRLDWQPSPQLREVGTLMLPGLAGTAIFQVNVVVSRSLAFVVDESAVAILYLANRLMEFPLGIFAIAVATVIFPELSRHAVRRDDALFGMAYRRGLLLIWLVMIPAAVGIFMLSEPIVAVLFQWGAFDGGDTARAAPIVAVFACTLPFYASATFATRGFHSLRDTATPVKIAALSFLLNLGCSLALMVPYGMTGLALANLISIIAQSTALQLLLAAKQPAVSTRRLRNDLLKILAAAGLMAVAVMFMESAASRMIGDSRGGWLAALALIITAGMAVYFAAVWLLRVEGRNEIEPVFRRLLRRG